jgi:hypothetical protein
MNTNMKKPSNHSVLFLFFFILGISSCTSHLSSEKINNISLIHAGIEITQNPTNKTDNSVVVYLADKNGSRISNDSLTIFVNGIEVKLTHRQGLYYSDESEYILSNVPVSKVYNVEIKLSNGEKHFLGSVTSLAEEKLENIECEKMGDLNNDFIVKWHNLIDIDELSVFVNMKEKIELNVTGITGKVEKIIKIKNNGSFTISKSEYKDTTATINSIEFYFRARKNGKTNPELLEGSRIIIETSIEKYVTFE